MGAPAVRGALSGQQAERQVEGRWDADNDDDHAAQELLLGRGAERLDGGASELFTLALGKNLRPHGVLPFCCQPSCGPVQRPLAPSFTCGRIIVTTDQDDKHRLSRNRQKSAPGLGHVGQ